MLAGSIKSLKNQVKKRALSLFFYFILLILAELFIEINEKISHGNRNQT